LAGGEAACGFIDDIMSLALSSGYWPPRYIIAVGGQQRLQTTLLNALVARRWSFSR